MAGRPRRISDAQRQAIVADALRTIGTPNGSVRDVAARHGVSQASVRRFVQEETGEATFGTPETRLRMQNAIDATVQTFAARRAALAERFLAEVERSLRDMHEPATVFNFGGKDNTFEARVLPEPPTADKRNLMIIAATAVDKHKILDQYDSDARDADAVTAWLESMTGRGKEKGGRNG